MAWMVGLSPPSTMAWERAVDFERHGGERGVGHDDAALQDQRRADLGAAADGGRADDDGVGADLDIVADRDGAEQVGGAVDVDVVADPDALALIDEIAAFLRASAASCGEGLR